MPTTTNSFRSNTHLARDLRHDANDHLSFGDRLQSALTIAQDLNPLPQTDGCDMAVSYEQVEQVVELRRLLENIHRDLPHVECWVAGYARERQGEPDGFTGFFGCETQEQAEAIAQAANEKRKTNRPTWQIEWEARKTDIDVTNLVRPDAYANDVISGLYV